MAKVKNKKIKNRIIYTPEYYKMQAIIRDPWTIDKIAWLKKRFTEVGCPLPRNGFKHYKQYLAWNDRYWKRYSEMQRLKEYHEGRIKITGGKERISPEEFWQLQDFDYEFLPPVYGAIYREIFEYFKLPTNNSYYHDFFEAYIFFGKTDYSISPFRIRIIRNQKTGKFEFFIQLFGHTRKEDIINRWDFIATEQKNSANLIGKSAGKNKEWETLDRDIEVYKIYKEIKSNHEIARERDIGFQSIFKARSVDTKIFTQIHEKYPKLTITAIRSIVRRTKKRLGEL
ncbi:hypothetical protein C4572_00090 [Candidatus Parcubacteria bacterium]|nr:MAG: hypothetical protein C4572_00090 [Candidatus Parcubacteria bacterium]